MPSNPLIPSALAPSVKLALRSKDAAKAMGISERLLATLVAEDRIPFVRINTAVLFPIRELQDWLTAQTGKEGQP